MTIAVTGSTGQLGRLVIAELQKKVATSKIVALARSAAKASDLGVSVREADYNSPVSVQSALEGVDTLLLISSSEVGQRLTQHRNVIQAAQAANVSRIVYTSLLHADTSPLSLADEHKATEAILKESGLRYTILRNGWYTENHTGSIPAAIANGTMVGSAGDGRISSAPRADYALAAVKIITGEGHDGMVYELAGDESYNLSEFAAEVSRQTDKNIPYNNVPETAYADILKSVGLPEGLAQAIASWDVGASQGALLDEGKKLSALIGRPTTPLTDVIASALSK